MNIEEFKIKVIKLKKNDIIVFKTKNPINQEQVNEAKARLKKEIGIKNKIMYLGPNTNMSILRK